MEEKHFKVIQGGKSKNRQGVSVPDAVIEAQGRTPEEIERIEELHNWFVIRTIISNPAFGYIFDVVIRK